MWVILIVFVISWTPTETWDQIGMDLQEAQSEASKGMLGPETHQEGEH